MHRVDNLISYYRLAIKKNLSREHIMRLTVFLEWIVALPETIAPYYNQQLEHLEEEQSMSYISIIERQGIEKGIEQGLEKGLEQGLEQGVAQGVGKGRLSTLQSTLQKLLKLKFGEASSQYQQRIEHAQEEELNLWTERVLFADSLEAVFAAPE